MVSPRKRPPCARSCGAPKLAPGRLLPAQPAPRRLFAGAPAAEIRQQAKTPQQSGGLPTQGFPPSTATSE
ncbi:hypothetical protein NDU88_002462 [Pleurodeles waltl]|uniref:Uncharacterized protein n=1 Tax=Pleurodeles waltl TaxID=8319 RepID=A0AAV7RDF5_PLEWA|nr:hypothetical protein NDU88_002462 [Pleurodeles waltl]